MSIVIKTPEFRASYPKVFKSELNKLNNSNEFSVIALFAPGANLSELQAAATQACEEKWGKDQSKWPKNLKNPFRDQKEKGKDIEGKFVLPDGHTAGAKFLTIKTKDSNGNKPEVYDMDGKRTFDESKIYAGVWCKVVCTVKAYEKAGNCGVNFYLVGIQKVKDDTPLAGKVSPESFFTPVEGAEQAQASGAGGLFS